VKLITSVAMLLLVFFVEIITFAISGTWILFFVVLGSGFFSAALFVMDVIFGALFTGGMFCVKTFNGGMYVVMTFVVTHVCVFSLYLKLLLILTQ
jgi:hypothetical protein